MFLRSKASSDLLFTGNRANISRSSRAHPRSETRLPRVTQGSHYCLHSPLIAEADGSEKRLRKWGAEDHPKVEKQGCV